MGLYVRWVTVTPAEHLDGPSSTEALVELSDTPRIDSLDISVYTVPTDAPESDGTLAWDSTTVVVVEPRAGDISGLGYTYADATAGRLVARCWRRS